MRIALLTTGLRPVPLAFAALPGTPVGIVRWDRPERPSVKRLLQETPVVADTLARVRSRPFASLPRLCAHHQLRYADVDSRDGTRLAETLRDWDIELVITSGCAIVPMKALRGILHGGINLHPSPLPRYRGGDPLLWQVLAGEPELGVCVHRLAQGSDTGDVLELASVPRPHGASREQLTALTERDVGVPLLARAIEKIAAGTVRPIRQPANSPTRYARAVAADRLPELVPGDSLDASVLADAIAFLGHCPPGWRPSESTG